MTGESFTHGQSFTGERNTLEKGSELDYVYGSEYGKKRVGAEELRVAGVDDGERQGPATILLVAT